MNCIRIEIEQTFESNATQRWIQEAQQYLHVPLHHIHEISCYVLEADMTQDEMKDHLISSWHDVFVDPVLETMHLSSYPLPTKQHALPSHVVEVGFRAGVTDNVARSAEEALSLHTSQKIRVATKKLYFLFGLQSHAQAHKVAHALLGNPLIQTLTVWDKDSFPMEQRFQAVHIPTVHLEKQTSLYEEIDLAVDMSSLLKQSQECCWALNKEEISHIQDHFHDVRIQSMRTEKDLPIMPTDVEMEVIAQTWSEHCKHKIFAADIHYTEKDIPLHYPQLGETTISSLFKTYVRQATLDIEKQRGIDWLRSIFHDNAGVVRFDPHVDLAIKVETHNSPSALDPYGGAITGILGVNRDIIGVGMGAKPIANMDVFCFADPQWPLPGDEKNMPVGLLEPRRLLEGVHKGVEAGGNKSGIPTVNGAIFFDQDYAGKPLVFVGTVGVMPHNLLDGTSGVHKEISVGDRIVMVGGAIGADGIHGATFSSLELNEHAPATAVQIGDPITQKRTMDFLLEARDKGLFSALTDNGAGGLSSSVGEMATLSNGACIDLQKAPTKYPNLKAWELMVSESQERMTVAVPPELIAPFLELATRRGVLATDIGFFTDDGNLDIWYGDTRVGFLSLEFLHESLPKMKLSAEWHGPQARKTWIHRDDRSSPQDISLRDIIETLLRSPNIRSKESWVRQYDHEVQGSTHIKPFGGKTGSGPNDAGVIWLYPHGGEKDSAVSIGCGLAPRISLHDPYLMAQFAVDEAIRNVVATGGDIDHTCLLDNFCWPDPVQSDKTPDGKEKLGQLVRTCAGLYDICLAYGTPLVSGKDSMKNDFRGKNGHGDALRISILPTLLITAMSKARITQTQTSAFQQPGDIIYHVGTPSTGLAGSEYATHFVLSSEEDTLPFINIENNRNLYRSIHKGCVQQIFSSLHDISDGGLLCALIESCFGNRLGCTLTFWEISYAQLFSEGPGQFVVSIPPEKEADFRALLQGHPIQKLGYVCTEAMVCIKNNNQEILNHPVDEFFNIWKEEL